MGFRLCLFRVCLKMALLLQGKPKKTHLFRSDSYLEKPHLGLVLEAKGSLYGSELKTHNKNTLLGVPLDFDTHMAIVLGAFK